MLNHKGNLLSKLETSRLETGKLENIDLDNIEAKQAWVVFTNQSDLKFLRILRSGFRHCFILINDGEHWLSIDPMANYMEVSIHHNIPVEFDFPNWLEQSGNYAIKAKLARNIKRCAPVMLFTCVEACKRILGVHKAFIFTPWQLYKYLKTHKA